MLLVTGGAGFIGANYLKYILNNDLEEKIICIDALTYAGNYKTIEDLVESRKVIFYHGNINDKNLIKKIFRDHEITEVINFAAESHVDRSIEAPSIFLETNIIGTQVLLDACLKFGNIRFHQVSTDEVYGDLPLEDKSLLFKEDSYLKPSSPYSASKTSADLLCLSYYKTFGLPITISRCSNNYGPYQFPEKLIPLMIINALNDIKLPVYGDGKNVRDWLYVDDHNSAIYEILKKGTIGEVYNIGGNNEQENISIVKLILDKLNKTESLIEYVEDRKGHDRRYAIDATKIKNELGWIPKTTFIQGISETIEWYLKNEQWWSNIVSGDYQDYYKRIYGR